MPQPSTTMTIRLEPELKARLDKLSKTTHRSKSFLAAEAVREFIELNEWQVEELKAAIKEADANDFASDQEVDAIYKDYLQVFTRTVTLNLTTKLRKRNFHKK